MIYHRSLGAKCADAPPPASAGLLISVDDAPELPRAITLEDALAQGDTDRDITPSPDDLIMICTGGTTGRRPKGVLWRQCDTYVVSMNGDDHSCAEEIHEKVRNAGRGVLQVRAGQVDSVLGRGGRDVGVTRRTRSPVQP